jgi:hypothetical protein
MPDPALDVDDDLPRIELVPAPVQILGDCTKLDNKVSREVLWLGLATFLPPQPHQGGLVIAHDDPGVGAPDEISPFGFAERLQEHLRHCQFSSKYGCCTYRY